MITDDGRAFKRSKRKFNIKHKPRDAKGKVGGSAITENISLGGVYFMSLQEFPIGQVLDLEISMSEIAEIGRWVARVVRCEFVSEGTIPSFGVAVEFVKAFGDSEKKLKRLLEEDR